MSAQPAAAAAAPAAATPVEGKPRRNTTELTARLAAAVAEAEGLEAQGRYREAAELTALAMAEVTQTHIVHCRLSERLGRRAVVRGACSHWHDAEPLTTTRRTRSTCSSTAKPARTRPSRLRTTSSDTRRGGTLTPSPSPNSSPNPDPNPNQSRLRVDWSKWEPSRAGTREAGRKASLVIAASRASITAASLSGVAAAAAASGAAGGAPTGEDADAWHPETLSKTRTQVLPTYTGGGEAEAAGAGPSESESAETVEIAHVCADGRQIKIQVSCPAMPRAAAAAFNKDPKRTMPALREVHPLTLTLTLVPTLP